MIWLALVLYVVALVFVIALMQPWSLAFALVFFLLVTIISSIAELRKSRKDVAQKLRRAR